MVKFYTDHLIKAGLPIEFAILPLIESGNNPQAKSKKNALGLWQFIPETGSEFNLKKASFDDRTDVEKSTRAAIELLTSLYAQFHDWNLVLASYNWGAGSVTKAIKKGLINKNGKINLKFLPNETQNYLILFYAYNKIINEEYNSDLLKKYPNKAYIQKIQRAELIHYLNQHAQLAKASPSLLQHINGYDIYKHTNKNEVLVPTDIFSEYFSVSRISFSQSIKSYQSYVGCSDQNALTYKTRYGDSFESIASSYRIKVDKLMDLNPSIRFVRPGMQINICTH